MAGSVRRRNSPRATPSTKAKAAKAGGVMAKLGARNRVEIAAWAWESRLVGSA
ncbi:hypothetical protein [Streptomyces sp. NPDC101234]|uniref:hypothetical protein n=1 Tax=Streptomyces sp. NPDC101234 TaxID=3366138 RepID=UPI0037F6571D